MTLTTKTLHPRHTSSTTLAICAEITNRTLSRTRDLRCENCGRSFLNCVLHFIDFHLHELFLVQIVDDAHHTEAIFASNPTSCLILVGDGIFHLNGDRLQALSAANTLQYWLPWCNYDEVHNVPFFVPLYHGNKRIQKVIRKSKKKRDDGRMRW